ncbi:Transcription factor TFIIIC tau55-related protein [Penicillium cf. griseofulvum]|uniref:Transcription factor TFIIIC tau55-related protein n=1 Tax=Penicillium cf. griseofulvum TaxID=2972120 RepID=A0A9W9MQY3_9EURO|nr:Transcription factor TFIIIC tau55-related protein [Penicillium cf. griseofulvum]KAJ5449239.1 Transcription factor TFIIIC tau55-related protein [Penicillium cf. griseofulvum]
MDTMVDSDSDGEYEYEYGTETETFYLNLDLTAHHGPVRPPRRCPQEAESLENTQNPPEEMSQGFPSEAYHPIESAETSSLPNERIQILDLHTTNPIISYYNQMFSCSWADQIGTELVFASPDTETGPDNHLPQPLHRGPSYELVAANSVKILGRKAHLAPNAGPGPAQGFTEGPTPESALSQEASPLGVPRRPTGPSHQAQFLYRLQQIKNAKGETDAVRMVMSTRRQVNMADRQQGWARTEAQLAEIERLNERASRGDLEAKATLDLLIQELNQELNPDEAEAESESDSELTSDSDDLTS